ncbi:elongation of very long chain fatty acids protein 4-like [Hyposmocoma kahamanoa]|uniref:elongation of very long chain fatty acids protein 4-like n=1 Tax=Hyposmocoma kahamanoa TaxID=1477025 RepID=UPI000E6D611B|nr:elongation of very long chain fatty acids protein 4-like [Hyposmocoma kahamanoa]
MATSNITDKYVFNFKEQWEFVDRWPLMSSPWPMLFITASYLLFVFKLGPAYMKGKQPYNLKNIILVYNIVQVFVSCYISQYGVQTIMNKGLLEWNTCWFHSETFRYVVGKGHYYYFLAKLSELLDTVFFVLRKKWNQVSFLHVYHHTLMFIGTWVTLKYEPSYSLFLLGTVNSFVHIIMYAYYGMAAFPSLRKYLWWKKYITKMQLIQFVAVMIHIQINTTLTQCRLSYFLLTLIWSNFFLFLYLFGNFYVNSYIKKRNDEKNEKNNFSKHNALNSDTNKNNNLIKTSVSKK